MYNFSAMDLFQFSQTLYMAFNLGLGKIHGLPLLKNPSWGYVMIGRYDEEISVHAK